MADLMIRPATPSDLDTLVPLFDGYRVFYGQTSDPALARSFLSERLDRLDTVLILAEVDGAGAGFTHLFPMFSSTRCARLWLLNDLFVAEHARKHGVARALLRAAEAHARATGACGLELATAHTNTPAQRLYESMGWQLDTAFRHYEMTL